MFVSSMTPTPFLAQANPIVIPLVEFAIIQRTPVCLAQATSNAAMDEFATPAFVPMIAPVETPAATTVELLEVAQAEMSVTATLAFSVSAHRALRTRCVPT